MLDLLKITSFIDTAYPQNKGFFIYGSWAYGTNDSLSDIDIMVIEDSLDGKSEISNYDFHFLSEKEFKKDISKLHIRALEGLFGPYSFLKFEVNVKMDNEALREAISQKASHSFVKAKKKIEVEKELRIGQKSLFHSLRILEFGIQIAQTGKIFDFTQSNHYWEEISKISDWAELNRIYKPIYNKLHTEFKLACPKPLPSA